MIYCDNNRIDIESNQGKGMRAGIYKFIELAWSWCDHHGLEPRPGHLVRLGTERRTFFVTVFYIRML